MTEGSVQLKRYLRARRAGTPTENAAAQAGITLAEARLTDADEARGLLTHIDTSEMPHRAFQQQTGPAAARSDQRRGSGVNEPSDGADIEAGSMVGSGSPQHQENDMARGKRKVEQVVEVHKPDFALAKRIYFNDIKPAQSKVGEFAQEQSTAYKEIKKAAHIQPQAAKAAFALIEMEESKRDDYLRSFNGLLTEFNIFMPRDLVDQAEDKPLSNVVPIGESARPQLATIPGDDSDLAGDDDATWRAGLKEGDAVVIPSEVEGEQAEAGVISFVDGDNLDVDVGEGGAAETVTVARAEVGRPQVADEHHQIAAE